MLFKLKKRNSDEKYGVERVVQWAFLYTTKTYATNFDSKKANETVAVL